MAINDVHLCSSLLEDMFQFVAIDDIRLQHERLCNHNPALPLDIGFLLLPTGNLVLTTKLRCSSQQKY